MAVIETGRFEIQQLLPASQETLMVTEVDITSQVTVHPLDCLLTKEKFMLWLTGDCRKLPFRFSYVH